MQRSRSLSGFDMVVAEQLCPALLLGKCSWTTMFFDARVSKDSSFGKS